MAGAFGNPLSAGIALQVDLNKIFNDQRKLKLAEDKLKMSQEAARAKQRKADEKELAGILSKITSDDSKIWWRYQDDAKHSYANTIRDVSNAWKAGDYNSAYTKLNEHNVKMTGLQQATKLKDDWITRSMKGDVYVDDEFLKALEDRNKTIEDVAALGAKTGYGIYNDASGTMGFAPLTQVHDSIENMKAVYDSVEGQYVMDENNQPKQMGTDPVTRAVIYEKRSLSPEQAYQMWNSGFANDAQRLGELRKSGVDVYSMKSPEDFYKAWQEYGMNLARTMGAGKQEFRKMADKEEKDWSYSNGGIKSKDYSIRYTDRPVDLSKEIGGELMGYDVNYIGTKQNEPMRTIRVSQGSYFAEGGDKFLKVSDSESGEGVNIKAQPGGIYMRKDKPASEGVWLRYVTPYAPASMGVEQEGVTMEELKYGQTDEDWAKMNAAIDLYVPAKTLSEASDFLSAMNLPPEEYNRLVSDLTKRFGEMTPTQSTTTVQSR